MQIHEQKEQLDEVSKETEPVQQENEKQAAEDKVRQSIEKVRQSIEDSKSRIPYLRGVAIALWVMGILWMLSTIINVNMILFRSAFAHELERFTLRIQGLASKPELAELVTKELAVKDENTAKEFVDVMAKIANRYKVGPLVDTFLLWGPPDPSSADLAT